MTTTNNQTRIYTIARTANLLKVNQEAIQFVSPIKGENKVQIGLVGTNAYLTKTDYLRLVAQERKNRATGMAVQSKDGETFIVTNTNNGNSYTTHALYDAVTCDCPDFGYLASEVGSQVCCKHGYAVLNTLGFSSLQAYIKDQKSKMEAMESQEFNEFCNLNDY